MLQPDATRATRQQRTRIRQSVVVRCTHCTTSTVLYRFTQRSCLPTSREGKTNAVDWFQSAAPTVEIREATKTLPGCLRNQRLCTQYSSTQYQVLYNDQWCFPLCTRNTRVLGFWTDHHVRVRGERRGRQRRRADGGEGYTVPLLLYCRHQWCFFLGATPVAAVSVISRATRCKKQKKRDARETRLPTG